MSESVEYPPVRKVPYRLVGGPRDGETIELDEGYVPQGNGSYRIVRTDLIEMAEAPDMAYHRYTPPPANWDPDGFIKNLPEPVPSETVYEWHEREWRSPAVRAIQEAYREASDR